MILNDKQIDELAPYLFPEGNYVGHQVRQVDNKPVISYGLSSYGYDIRLGNTFELFAEPVMPSWPEPVIDPLDFNHSLTTTSVTDTFILPPHSYVLAHSVEYLRMPSNLNALCIGKSTLARAGLMVNTTPIEAGWEGQITLEIFNLTPYQIKLHAGHGIAQLQFFSGQVPNVSYSDRGGKYQGQRGVTLPKV